MRKKILTLCLALLMLSVSVVGAQGAEMPGDSCKVASAYFTGEDLYVFLEPQEGKNLPSEMGLLLNQAQVDTATPESVWGSDTQVSYLFLMDLSTSMIEYQEQVMAFSEDLFRQEKQPIQVILAGFGDRFEVLEKDLTTDSAVRQAIRSVAYDHTATDLPGGVAQAAQYLATEMVPQGEVVNVVVFTDGIPWPEQSESRTEEAAALENTIVETPEMILHSVVFGSQGDPEILAALATGSGVDVAVPNSQNVAPGGEQVAAMVDGLSKLVFQPGIDMNSPRFEGQIFFNNDGASSFLTLKNVRNYPIALPVDHPPTAQPAASYEPEPTPTTQPTLHPENPVSEAPTESGQGPSSSVEEEPHSAVESSAAAGFSQRPEAGDQSIPWIWIAAGCGVVAAVLVITGMVLRSRAKGKTTEGHVGVAVKLEIIRGHQKGSQRIFYLDSPLIIGSGASCQLIWKDKDMPAQSARVFLQDQAVFIEGLTSAEVYIGGIRIYTSNRLRSGDEVTIANTKFSFRF